MISRFDGTPPLYSWCETCHRQDVILVTERGIAPTISSYKCAMPDREALSQLPTEELVSIIVQQQVITQ